MRIFIMETAVTVAPAGLVHATDWCPKSEAAWLQRKMGITVGTRPVDRSSCIQVDSEENEPLAVCDTHS